MTNIELDSISNKQVKVKGKELRVRWMDSYVVIWSAKDHPYEEE